MPAAGVPDTRRLNLVKRKTVVLACSCLNAEIDVLGPKAGYLGVYPLNVGGIKIFTQSVPLDFD